MKYSSSFRFVGPTLAMTLMVVVAGCERPTPVEEVRVKDSGVVARPVSLVGEATDLAWPQWRGTSQGVATDRDLPVTWSETDGDGGGGAGSDAGGGVQRWSADVPGRGHSSPIVVNDLVVIATATRQPDRQWVIAYDRNDGSERWKTVVHEGTFPPDDEIHSKATHANSTVASDGRHFITTFFNDGHIWATALDADGETVWQTDVGAFRSKFGYAPSPTIYKSLAILAVDNRGGGYLAALDTATGEIAWRRRRDDVDTYSSPAVVNLGGEDQLILTGGDQMASYDPATGEPKWSTECIAQATCGTVAATDQYVFASGGYPSRETVCLDASGQRVWTDKTKIYEPSMVTDGENLYGVTDGGVAQCWSVETGETLWKERLGGKFSSSPVLCNGNLYVADLSGNVFVIRASGDEYELVAKNRLGDDCYASPAIAGDALFFRVGRGEGEGRTEHLYCIGKPTD